MPAEVDGLALRHAMDVRHASFKSTEYLTLARRHRVATVFTDSDDYPSFADRAAIRLRPHDAHRRHAARGMHPQALAQLAAAPGPGATGNEPAGVPRVEPAPAPTAPRDVFMFFISGAKEGARRQRWRCCGARAAHRPFADSARPGPKARGLAPRRRAARPRALDSFR